MTSPSDFTLPRGIGAPAPAAPLPPVLAEPTTPEPLTPEQALEAGYAHLDHMLSHWLGAGAQFDQDGWLTMNRAGQPFGLTRFNDPANQVWLGAVAVAIANVDESIELYRALTQANRELNVAKVGWHNQQVWVAGEIAVLPWMRPDDAMLLAERVTGAARAVGELMQPQFGGQLPPTQVDQAQAPTDAQPA